MRVIQCVRSLAKTYGLRIYAIMLPSSGFSVAHCARRIDKTYHNYVASQTYSSDIIKVHLSTLINIMNNIVPKW